MSRVLDDLHEQSCLRLKEAVVVLVNSLVPALRIRSHDGIRVSR